jgi:lipoyl(octanoyl) transferase
MEHFPILTKGRISDPKDIFFSAKDSLNLEIVETDRGGQITFHGPGQLIAYPIINIKSWGGPHKYIRALENVIIESLKALGIDSYTISGLTGVWVNDEKIAAIGVKISKGVAYHGFSLNVNTDLKYYDHFIPCGISEKKVTSIKKVRKTEYSMQLVKDKIIKQLSEHLDFN